MKASVVVPTYNRAYIIREALESILTQDYPDLEVIVVDDGSTDNTREVAEGLQDTRIHYIRHDANGGCSAAYNAGIRGATGEVIAFLDSDDVWKRGYLKRQMQFLSRNAEVGVVFTDTEVIGGPEPITSLSQIMPHLQALLAKRQKAEEYVFGEREMYLCLLEEVPLKPSATIVRREMFERAGMFDEAWPSGTDWDLFLRLSRVSRFGYIDRVLATQRRTGDATHQMFLEKDKSFLLRVFSKEKATLANDRHALRCVNRGLGGLYNSLAWHYLQSGRRKEALSTYYHGFKETLQPKLLKKLAVALLRARTLSIRRKKESKSSGADISLGAKSVKTSDVSVTNHGGQ